MTDAIQIHFHVNFLQSSEALDKNLPVSNRLLNKLGQNFFGSPLLENDSFSYSDEFNARYHEASCIFSRYFNPEDSGDSLYKCLFKVFYCDQLVSELLEEEAKADPNFKAYSEIEFVFAHDLQAANQPDNKVLKMKQPFRLKTENIGNENFKSFEFHIELIDGDSAILRLFEDAGFIVARYPNGRDYTITMQTKSYEALENMGKIMDCLEDTISGFGNGSRTMFETILGHGFFHGRDTIISPQTDIAPITTGVEISQEMAKHLIGSKADAEARTVGRFTHQINKARRDAGRRFSEYGTALLM